MESNFIQIPSTNTDTLITNKSTSPEGYTKMFIKDNMSVAELISIFKDTTGRIVSKEIELESNIKYATDKIADQEKESSNRVIQLVTIFITFFTFVSIEFKILQNAPNICILIGLSLFLLGGLLGFAIIINKILIGTDSKTVKNIDRWCLLIVIVGIIFSCIGIRNDYVKNKQWEDYYKKLEIDIKLNEKLDKSDKQLQNCLENKYYINCNK